MTDFDYAIDGIEADVGKNKSKIRRWKDTGGTLPEPKRGYPWKCDCKLGNPEPNRVVLDARLHDIGCAVRKRVATPGYMETTDIFGR